MQELIFIIILAVFIGGMLWSDRDSRYEKSWCYNCGAMSWTERYEPIIRIGVNTTPSRFTAGPMDFSEMFNSDLIISNAYFSLDIASAGVGVLPPVTFTESEKS